ncbi:hypothetical protein IWW36_001024 [Coemansia brasiliensis]|uniref:RING-type domain-containing protein n=1 Tax=Coemansia brasiliensis TaxID=2650707 RepID=A0A9W8I9Y8_9FUNG|nr:hypothetical protein IWW36_001024 [Coemansia brasiliensis]
MESIHGSQDVWQQLQEFRFSESLIWMLEYAVGLPSKLMAKTEDSNSVNNAQPAENLSGKRGSAGDATYTVVPESVQILGLFGSRFFLFALLIGFIISRIHVLVHRQRIRALGAAARVALYLPVLVLVMRALAIECVALDAQPTHGEQRWMQDAVAALASVARKWGIANTTAHKALWTSFASACIFDCIDVFVARLEGSPCAPYEYIGALIERTSLYYFYGGSVRIQELAILILLEKLLLGTVLLVLPNGWRWRLIPTGATNLLTLHHCIFCLRSPSAPHAIYPFVQILSMGLLIVSLTIVVVTVTVYSLARIVDRVGIARNPPSQQRAVALYDRNGVFQGTTDDDDIDGNNNDGLLELASDVAMPFMPDLRRDFSVEILDLAGTCLQQCSNQIRATGLARSCGAIRLPRTTALDEYVDQVLNTTDGSSMCWREFPGRTEPSRSGLSVFIEDEPSVLDHIPTSSADIAHLLRDTRASSVRKLSLGMWALVAALGHYALERKMGPLDPGASSSEQRANKPGRLNVSGRAYAGHKAGSIEDFLNDDSNDESDYDYICAASDTSDASDEELESEGLVGETAELVSDILCGRNSEQPGDRLAATVTFMAHSLVDRSAGGSNMMTRSMYAQQMSRISDPEVSFLGVLSGMYQSEPVAIAAPFARDETESLAQLIQSRRSVQPHEDETRSLCVVCWTNVRTVMLRPCRCLCLCNDCRAALVVRSFDHCPCCRRTVAGYSRVYPV